jgi:hypothetical protein
VHEVYIDDEQMAWFESVLAANQDKPIIMFTHAPPMGSGLKVVQNVHVKNRCAWLNHSDRYTGEGCSGVMKALQATSINQMQLVLEAAGIYGGKASYEYSVHNCKDIM